MLPLPLLASCGRYPAATGVTCHMQKLERAGDLHPCDVKECEKVAETEMKAATALLLLVH